MSFLSRIFARPEDGSKLIDSAVKTLDNAFFTKQERADASQKVSDFYLRFLEATQGQNLARRYIAVLVVALWVSLVVLMVAAYHFSVAYSTFIYGVLVDVVMQPFSIIIGFYFLTHAVRSFKKGDK